MTDGVRSKTWHFQGEETSAITNAERELVTQELLVDNLEKIFIYRIQQ